MSSLLKGLADFKAAKKKIEEDRQERDRPSVKYFNWKNNKGSDKNVVFVRFLQEFDNGIDTYREDRGLPMTAIEHQAPGMEGFKRRASCTLENEGRCYACERHREDRSLGWQQRKNFYTWALVDYSDGEGPVPVVISRGFSSTFVDDLIMEVEDAEGNAITNKMFRIVRTGTGKSTQWKLKESKVELYDDSDVEVPPIESVLRAVSYDDQPAYYGAVYKDGDPLDKDDDEKPAAPAKEKTGELVW